MLPRRRQERTCSTKPTACFSFQAFGFPSRCDAGAELRYDCDLTDWISATVWLLMTGVELEKGSCCVAFC